MNAKTAEAIGIVDGADRGNAVSQTATLFKPLPSGTKLYAKPADNERAGIPEKLPEDVAQEVGEFYESYVRLNPKCLKADAMQHAWTECFRYRLASSQLTYADALDKIAHPTSRWMLRQICAYFDIKSDEDVIATAIEKIHKVAMNAVNLAVAAGALEDVEKPDKAPTAELFKAYRIFNDTYRGMNMQQALCVAINSVLEGRRGKLVKRESKA